MARHRAFPLLSGTAAALLLAGCSGPLDVDMRRFGGGLDTSSAAHIRTADRPATDPRGVISYPTFQVAVARRGDTVASVAERVGLPAGELALYNGLGTGDVLREDEVLALPIRVTEPATGFGGIGTPSVDVAVIAGGALDRAEAGRPAPLPAAAAAPTAPEPVRHQVVRGETAYSIARLYSVPVRSLAEWNGLGADFTLREGQFLMIPVAVAAVSPRTPAVETPGAGSRAPEPPSAQRPLPEERTIPAAAVKPPVSPDLGAARTTLSRLQMPVEGKVIRAYAKKSNEGIDIGAAAGAPVVSAGDGTVAAITRDTDQVPIIVIRHDGNLLTVYAGLDNVKVAKGDKVKRGQQIGTVRAGSPAFVHFEVREGLESTDPMPFLN